MENVTGNKWPFVAVIVLNYKTWLETIECLESLQKIEYPNYQIIVVDNGSQDGSVEKIKQWAEGKIKIESEYTEYRPDLKPVFYIEYDRKTAEAGGIPEKEEELEKYPSNRKMVIIQTGENLGFSGGNNVGARYAYKKDFEYILLLNNDTIIIDKDFIRKLLYVIKTFQKVKMVGPKIINFSNSFDGPYVKESFWKEILWLSIKNQLHKILGCLPAYIDSKAIRSHKPVEVYKISGACLFLDLNFFHEIGYLDERLWLSSEEAALAEAIRNKGFKTFFQPLTVLLHKKASSPRNQTWYQIKKKAIEQREFFLKEYKKYSSFKLFIVKLMNRLRLFIALLQSKKRKF